MKSLIEAECDHIDAHHALLHLPDHTPFEERLKLTLEVAKAEERVEAARMEEESARCPRCGSDNPALAFDTLRPEKAAQDATWTDSGGGINYVCPDAFHEPAHPEAARMEEE